MLQGFNDGEIRIEVRLCTFEQMLVTTGIALDIALLARFLQRQAEQAVSCVATRQDLWQIGGLIVLCLAICASTAQGVLEPTRAGGSNLLA